MITLFSNLVIFKYKYFNYASLICKLYIPIWLYSNQMLLCLCAIFYILYIPIWLYSNLPKGDINKHIEFIEKYGFLYPLLENEYTAIEASDLVEIINRVKSTIRLYSCINKKYYWGVLIHVIYLLFAPVTEIQIGEKIYSTCTHNFKRLLDSYNLFPDLSRELEVAANGTYSVDDVFLGKKNAIDISFYNAVRSGSDTNLQGSKDPWFKNLMAMYMGCKGVDEETRFLIDFFYHLQTEVSVIKEVYFGGFKSYTTFSEDVLNDSFKNALLKIARIVVAEGINHNIRGIHPKYNGGKLTATWQVDTLIEALYFSIFYMKMARCIRNVRI